MSDLTATVPPAHSPTASDLLDSLRDYRRRFLAAASEYDGLTTHAHELEELTASYSLFVTDERHLAPFAELEQRHSAEVDELVTDLRRHSGQCVAIMEKYRALKLLDGHTSSVGYFANIESCIEEEFGAVCPTKESAVLLIGSGAFPMTLLTIAERTGATTVGIDIDPEAVALSRQVIHTLRSDEDQSAPITVADLPAHELPFTQAATHIVISSTVEMKYDILQRLHAITRDDVIVAIRFGDGLKSLFNYPRQDVDDEHWRLTETIHRPDQVFDIALYAKQPPQREKR